MKILFITHETSRTGAPMVLLYLLRWIKHNKPETTVDVLALNGGDLIENFKEVSHCFYDYKQLIQPKKSNLIKRAFVKLGILKKDNLKERLLRLLKENNHNLIYANSIPTLGIASILKKQSKSSKLLLHLHELETVLRIHLDKKDNALVDVDKFIAVSGLVKSNLVVNWGVEEEKIEVVYEFSEIASTNLKKESKQFIIGASGTVEDRKGVDMFLQVARLVNKKIPKACIKFVWVGRNANKHFVQSDIIKMDLSEKVKFTGEQETPYEFFKEFDIFLMTSREDPFPLVCIEVASLKKPIICFESATGTQEILINGGGYIVPYLDVEQMAEKVIFYFNNQNEIIKDGEKCQQLFSKFTPEKSCPLIYDIIKKIHQN